MLFCLLSPAFGAVPLITLESDLICLSAVLYSYRSFSLFLEDVQIPNRDSFTSPNVLNFSQVPVHAHGQEIFRRKVVPPGPAFSVQLQPVDPKALHGSSAPLLLDSGKGQYCMQFMSLKEWHCECPFSE